MARRKPREEPAKDFRVLLIILEQHEDKFVCLCPAMDSMTEIHIHYKGMPQGAIEYIQAGNRFIHCESNFQYTSIDELFFKNWEWGSVFLEEANDLHKRDREYDKRKHRQLL